MEPGDWIRRILTAMDTGDLTMDQLMEAARLRRDDPAGLTVTAPEGVTTGCKPPEPTTLMADPNGPKPEPPPPTPRESAPGRYEVETKRHARGGIGEVWRARDRQLDRPVAIKRLRPDRLGMAATQLRFRREAQITARLLHPGIVPVFDLMDDGPEGNGGPWYTMRFVDGKTLGAATREYHQAGRNDADLRRLIEVVISVCQTIAYAHAADVLHRDIKGDNVILGEFGEVFVLDWGLAKQVVTADDEPSTEPDDPNPDLTRPGSKLGTPAYMAPEVARGEISTRLSDVYSLGAIVYSILAGRPPYQGTTPEEIVHCVDLNPPPPAISVNRQAPRSLDAICQKAMAREPADRYPSAIALADDLRRWLDDRPVSAYPDPWPVRIARWIRGHRTAAIATAATLLVSAVAMAIASAVLAQANQRTNEALNEAEQRFRLARDVVGRMLDVVSQRDLPPIVETVALSRNLNRLSVDLHRDLILRKPNDRGLALETAQIEVQAGDINRTYYDVNQANSYYEQAQSRLQELLDGQARPEEVRGLLASLLIDRADLEILRGTPIRALEHLDEADRIIDPARAGAGTRLDHLYQAGRSRLSRAAALETLGRTDEARSLIDESWNLLSRSAPQAPNSEVLLILVDCHRAMLRARTEPDEARAIAARNSQWTARILARRPQDSLVRQLHVIALKGLGRTLLDLGDNPAAESALAEAVDILSDLVERSHRLPRFLDDLAETQRDLARSRQGEQADADLRESVANNRELVERYPNIEDFRADLGLGLAALAARTGNPATRDEAVRLLDAALIHMPNNPDILAAKSALVPSQRPKTSHP